MEHKSSLNGKRILVTAGSTWVALDSVRVITNIFKGKIGLSIARCAAEQGALVTLLLGPSLDVSYEKFHKNIRLERFKYFDDLRNLMQSELTTNPYDVVIHSAAVSDFAPKNKVDGKIKSNVDSLIIELVPTKKIIDDVKNWAPSVYLVKFKLEVGIESEKLIEVAYRSLQQSNADLIVANIYSQNFTDHEAYIIDKVKGVAKIRGREQIANEIFKHLYDRN